MKVHRLPALLHLPELVMMTLQKVCVHIPRVNHEYGHVDGGPWRFCLELISHRKTDIPHFSSLMNTSTFYVKKVQKLVG